MALQAAYSIQLSFLYCYELSIGLAVVFVNAGPASMCEQRTDAGPASIKKECWPYDEL
jgi:hypothetical protein